MSSEQPIHLLMPMSGQGTRYRKVGYTEPKPLIPVNGRPMVQRLLANFPEKWPCHFVLAENHRDTGLPKLLKSLRSKAGQHYVAEHKLGPSFAALEGLKYIPEDAPVLLTYCDYQMVWDAEQFERFVRDSDCDACVISYRGFHAHYLSPVKYAYSRLDGERIVEVREKGSFTENREAEFASSGGYYFRSAKLLREAIEFQMREKMELGGEFYTSLTVEALLRMNPKAHVRVFEIPAFFQWGTPEDLKTFEYWEKTFQSHNRNQAPRFLDSMRVSQVLMPMAGLGSRFGGITNDPKPLIPINDVPMFKAALDSLPRGEKTVLVALDSFSEHLRPHCGPETTLVSLAKTPSGQALSTEAGISALDPHRDVFISSCDHAIVLNGERWQKFFRRPDCDAAILTMAGYPGADRKPASYAYVVPENGSQDPFPKVERVSVKKPVSDHPSDDAVLVGTFWFRSANILERGIQELKKRDLRVNGELYLDSVFEVLQSMGNSVRMIPLEGYICWGDPEALAEALYWQETFCGYRIDARPRFPGIQPR